MPALGVVLVFGAYKVVSNLSYRKLALISAIPFLFIFPLPIAVIVQGEFGFLPPGGILASSICLVIPIIFVATIFFIIKIFRNENNEIWIKKVIPLGIVGLIIYPLAFYFTGIVLSRMENYCNIRNREEAEETISGIHDYLADNNSFPEQIETLVPQYLPEEPISQCDPYLLRKFWIEQCSNEKYLLVIETIDGYQFQRYDFETNKWSLTKEVDWLEVGYNICDDLEYKK